MFDSMSIFSVPSFRHSGKFCLRSGSLGLALLVILAGCSLDNPLGRTFGWFDHLDAADIRDHCVGSTGERYRLIYNAVWGEQVRSYDIVAPPGGPSATLAARVFFPENLNQINLADPLELYRGHTGTAVLTVQDMTAFRNALTASGFDGPTPRGLILPSNSFYWVVAACRNGVFHYNAYLYPSPSFSGIQFDRWLFAHDPTGVAATPPGQIGDGDNGPHVYFEMMVGANGLVGVGSPF
jgi:hypothetical protein